MRLAVVVSAPPHFPHILFFLFFLLTSVLSSSRRENEPRVLLSDVGLDFSGVRVGFERPVRNCTCWYLPWNSGYSRAESFAVGHGCKKTEGEWSAPVWGRFIALS